MKAEKDGELAADVLKAEEFVRNMYKQRGEEWDGVRARARYEAQAYRSKVRALLVLCSTWDLVKP